MYAADLLWRVLAPSMLDSVRSTQRADSVGRLMWSSRYFRCALVLLLVGLPATSSSASVIYSFRETPSSPVLAWLEVAEPPASATSGWSTTDPADILAFYCDCLPPLPPTAIITLSLSITSLDGAQLDDGFFDVSYTIPPLNVGDPTTIGGGLMLFGGLPGEDEISGGFTVYYPDGQILIGDYFPVSGNFVVPEPTVLALLSLGVVSARWRRHRGTRRARTSE